jgi:hypothetical protein
MELHVNPAQIGPEVMPRAPGEHKAMIVNARHRLRPVVRPLFQVVMRRRPFRAGWHDFASPSASAIHDLVALALGSIHRGPPLSPIGVPIALRKR